MSEEEPDEEEEQARILNCDGLPKQQVKQVTCQIVWYFSVEKLFIKTLYCFLEYK
jgi:hypothetical protein